MLARQLAYITYVRGSMSTLQILLFPCFYSVWSPTLSREEPVLMLISQVIIPIRGASIIKLFVNIVVTLLVICVCYVIDVVLSKTPLKFILGK